MCLYCFQLVIYGISTNFRLKIILGSSSISTTPMHARSLEAKLVLLFMFSISVVDLVVVRTSSPENLPFYIACQKAHQRDQIKVDQIFSEGYHVKEWSFMVNKLFSWLYHGISLFTTLFIALWLRKQQKILSTASVGPVSLPDKSSNFKKLHPKN